jgi:cold shock CspA family protein
VLTGFINFINYQRKIGFITCTDTQISFILLAHDNPDLDFDKLFLNDSVTFEQRDGKYGHHAVNVRKIDNGFTSLSAAP